MDLDSLLSADNAVQGPLRLGRPDFRSPKSRISGKATRFLLGLVERGVRVDVCSQSRDDNLQSSINYNRNKEKSLRQDWTDDLDLSLIQDLS